MSLSSFKILVTDYVHPFLIVQFNKHALQCDYQPDITLADVHTIISDYHGIVVNSKVKCDRLLLDRAEKLRFIARIGSGLDNIDLGAAHERGIHVINSPEGNRNAVAEHALGMLLALKNKLFSAHREVKKSLWDREAHRGTELRNRIIGVYGYGHTGSSFVTLLQGFGVKVLVYDKYKERFADDLRFVTEVDETSLVSQSDIISFHLPLTTETHHLVNDKFLERCKPGVVIINTSRGKVVNTMDLLSGLRSGQVSGACLDVIENEKPHTWTDIEQGMYDDLWSMDQVIMSPHVAGWTEESKLLISEVLWAKIEDISWLSS